MSFVQNVFLGFGVVGISINYIQGNTNGILLNGIALVCLFLSFILDEIKKNK